MPVPGQVSAGVIDGYFRDDPGDGTLGTPDYSLVPYTYAPLLGPAESEPIWVLDQFRQNVFAGFKGSPDGLGVLRDTGQTNGAFCVDLVLTSTGVRPTSPDGSRSPDYTWGPRDAALAVRHPGDTAWVPGSVRAYVALDQTARTIGMRLTTADAEGPWDAEKADSAAISLASPFPDLWNGSSHSLNVAAFGSNVLVIIDGRIGVPFRAPRAYKRNANGTVNTGVFANLPTTGRYGGFDTRGLANFLFYWTALEPASGDFFSYDMGATSVQTPPAGTFTPATLPSGEAWNRTGTVTGSKDGVLMAASSSMYFTPASPHGYIATRWGSTFAAEGGLIFRRQGAGNYYLLTSTGVWRYEASVGTKIISFSIPANAHVLVQNFRSSYGVWVNGAQATVQSTTYWPTAGGIGFLSPAAGSSQFRYIGFQPRPQSPILPTS